MVILVRAEVEARRLAATLRKRWLRVLLGAVAGYLILIVPGAALVAFMPYETAVWVASVWAFSSLAVGGLVAVAVAERRRP